MDFGFSDEQTALGSLAREIFEKQATHARLKELEAGGEGVDARLWDELTRSGLVGLAVPEACGGGGRGLLEACIVLAEQGRTVAPVPLWPVYAASLALGRAGGQDAMLGRIASGAVVTVALDAEVRAGDGRLTGSARFVPFAQGAEAILVATTDGGLYLVRASDVTLSPLVTTAGLPESDAALDGAPATLVSADGAARLRDDATVALCAIETGVTDRALRITAEYTSGRKQFDRPLGSFQAVQQRAADAWIDAEAVRWTMWQAAWRVHEGLAASEEVSIAKFWAAEGGTSVLAACQHLHGGIGIDTDYPLHRYLYWTKQLELTLGGGTEHLARLGAAMAQRA